MAAGRHGASGRPVRGPVALGSRVPSETAITQCKFDFFLYSNFVFLEQKDQWCTNNMIETHRWVVPNLFSMTFNRRQSSSNPPSLKPLIMFQVCSFELIIHWMLCNNIHFEQVDVFTITVFHKRQWSCNYQYSGLFPMFFQ